MYLDHDRVYFGSDRETVPPSVYLFALSPTPPHPFVWGQGRGHVRCHMKLIEIFSNITHYVQYCDYIKVLDCTV